MFSSLSSSKSPTFPLSYLPLHLMQSFPPSLHHQTWAKSLKERMPEPLLPPLPFISDHHILRSLFSLPPEPWNHSTLLTPSLLNDSPFVSLSYLSPFILFQSRSFSLSLKQLVHILICIKIIRESLGSSPETDSGQKWGLRFWFDLGFWHFFFFLHFFFTVVKYM